MYRLVASKNMVAEQLLYCLCVVCEDLSTKFDSFDSLGDDVGHLKDEEDVGVLLLQLGKAWVVFWKQRVVVVDFYELRRRSLSRKRHIIWRKYVIFFDKLRMVD